MMKYIVYKCSKLPIKRDEKYTCIIVQDYDSTC